MMTRSLRHLPWHKRISLSLLTLLSFVGLTFFAGCTGHQQSNKNGDPPPLNSGGAKQELSGGASDGGGDNLIDGHPLEFFIKIPKNESAYRDGVEKKLSLVLKEQAWLARMINYVLEKKKWYFIPSSHIQKLPFEKVGVPALTEQGAIQNFSVIWNDDGAYQSMSSKDQQWHLLHEIVMGIRILKYDSPFNRCYSIAKSASDCTGMSTKSEGEATDVNSTDHDEVKAVTDEVMNFSGEIKSPDLMDILARHHFSMKSIRFPYYGDTVHYSGDQILEIFKRVAVAKNFPSEGTLWKEKPRRDQCGVEFFFEPSTSQDFTETIRIRLKTGDSGKVVEKRYRFDRLRKYSFRKEYLDDEDHGGHVKIEGLDLDTPSSVGQRHITFRFLFDSEESLMELDARDMICSKVDRGADGIVGCSEWANPGDKWSYTCSQKYALQYSLHSLRSGLSSGLPALPSVK